MKYLSAYSANHRLLFRAEIISSNPRKIIPSKKRIDISIFPHRCAIFAFPKVNILPEMRLPAHSDFFQKLPGCGISGITLRKDPVRTLKKRVFNHCIERLRGIPLSPVIYIDNVTDFLCFIIPVPAENIADHFS